MNVLPYQAGREAVMLLRRSQTCGLAVTTVPPCLNRSEAELANTFKNKKR
jgi:hypothetical protein